ncbi:MAG TPA: putative glycoside hydrolase [Steroidobacteraceae bacterium]|jgi:hypothetical protein
MRQLLISVCTVGLALAGAKAVAYTDPPFPRTGGINMASPYNYDDAAYQAALAQLDLMILKTYPGRASWNPAIQAIKKINPNALVFMYVNSNELGEPSVLGGTTWDAYRNKLDTMKWWLYSSGGSGTRVQSSFGANYYAVNNTPYTPRDSSGYTSMEWIARYFVDNYYKNNTSIDGFFMDNTFWKPTIDGDWNRDGKIDSKSDPASGTRLRQGYATWYTTARKLMPAGKFQIGNITTLGETAAVFPEYKGLLNGGVMEGAIGKSWSVEGYAGWDAMMGRYRKIMASVVAPKLVIFNQWGDPKDYRAARYGITSCLMDDGYHSFTDTKKGYTGVVRFDEYNAKLGMPVSTPPTKAWQSGVYRRDFEGGIALVNPKGNGAKTVTLEADFIALKGTQDPTVNNGQVVRKVSLQDRDGIILMRKTPVSRPKAPVLANQ